MKTSERDDSWTGHITLTYRGPLDLGQPDLRETLYDHVVDLLHDFPIGCEGVITLGGIVHFFTYMVKGNTVEVFVQPRVDAEALLNTYGLSTIEPWAPWISSVGESS